MAMREDALEYHARDRRGKLEVVATKPLLTQRDLTLAYSPGVAEPCRVIANRPDAAYDYTAKGNLVAVVTNGTAVLGLGNIGPLAGKPVMEGKANLFKKFADIDCFDIELDAKTADEVIAAVKAIAPTFGGINLEDIRAPECFRVESELKEALDIPVFHDDQHGTAIIAGAALRNACAVTDRDLATVRCVFSGAGAAAIATARLFVEMGVKREHIWMFDSTGLVYKGRTEQMFPEKEAFAQDGGAASLEEVLAGADVFVGLSVGGLLSGELVKRMAPRPIVFAMANPDPEITYDEAKAAVPDAIVATGRSDFPNQVNNVLGFPFLFRGALDCRAKGINEAMKVAAVDALAQLAREDVPDSVLSAYGLDSLSFGPDYLIPKPFDPRVLLWVAPAVARAAEDSGVARAPIADYDAYQQKLEQMIERSKELIRPLMNRARLDPARIVFTDGTNPKVLRAAQILVDEGICRPVLIGEEWKILQRADRARVDLKGCEIVDINDEERISAFAEELWTMRQRKGMTLTSARSVMHNPLWTGLMMVRRGEADGLVGGIATPYNQTIRPALQVLGTGEGVEVVSAVYAMLFKDRRLYFGDCTINRAPDAETMAHIALNTAAVAESLGDQPRVAMLSWSDFGEGGTYEDTVKVRKAVRIARSLRPDLQIDGEMQADTAVDPVKAKEDFPFSSVAGDANVLVFPDLASGNIAYKLLRDLGGATAVGPIIHGMGAPVNVLAIGSTVEDVVNVAAITVSQVLDRARKTEA
jgi:malate dehydrogenase (oxaloacetate-decarboxylating)(NADP+)